LFALPWIFGARADLAVSLGGMMAGFALFFMKTVIGWNVFQIHHHVLDQSIWRPSKSRQLRQQLNLEAIAAE
jgi:hypothetical protein